MPLKHAVVRSFLRPARSVQLLLDATTLGLDREPDPVVLRAPVRTPDVSGPGLSPPPRKTRAPGRPGRCQDNVPSTAAVSTPMGTPRPRLPIVVASPNWQDWQGRGLDRSFG